MALSGCASHPDGSNGNTLVTGSVTYRERIALTPDAVVEVKVVVGPSTIGSCRIDDPVQVPVAFAIPIPDRKRPGDGKAAIVATISDRGRVAFATAEPVAIAIGPGDADAGTVMLRAIAADPADPER